MFDYFNIDPSNEIVVTSVIVICLFLLGFLIPGWNIIQKYIVGFIWSHIIHKLFHAAVVVTGTWIGQMFFWMFKYLLFAVKGYCYHLTRTHEKIYPKLAKKKIGVIDE